MGHQRVRRDSGGLVEVPCDMDELPVITDLLERSLPYLPTFREDAEFAPFPESVEGRFPKPVEEEGQTENPLPQRYGTPMNPCDQSADNKWFPEKISASKCSDFRVDAAWIPCVKGMVWLRQRNIPMGIRE